jgi:conjugal transfer pilus assembly protein TraB
MNSSIFEKIKQWKRMLILLAVVVLISGGILYALSDSPKTQKALDTVSIQMTSGGERLNAEQLWREKMEDEQKAFKKGIEDMQGLLHEQRKKEESQKDTLNELQNSLLAFQNKVGAYMENPGFKPDNVRTEASNPEAKPIVIKKLVLSLAKTKNPAKASKTILDTIPAGAFVQAIMLSGMDASSAMNASSNPVPLLLRLIHPGTLPRYFKSDLKDCHCTASGYGDISSERIHVRLEKLSCIERATGEIVSTEVAGYIAGPDGREGVRGTIVSQEGRYLSRGALGGIFSGFAKVASPHSRQGIANPFGFGQSQTPSTQQLFQSGFLEGGSSALDKLSQYYINRAEQLQPVIQVPGGQVVDIVFTTDANIGESELKEAIKKTREKARAKALQNLAEPQTQSNPSNPFYIGEKDE